MKFITFIFTYLVIFLITIGDTVITTFHIITSFFVSVFSHLVKMRPKFRMQIGVKKKKRIKPTVFFPLPFSSKIKYFFYGTLVSFFFLFLPLVFLLFIQSLPNPHELSFSTPAQTTRIYDRHHTLLYQIYAAENRTLVPLADIPRMLRLATIATEDKNFYANPGFDITAIVRALWSDVTHQQFQGASTITQQLIKSSLLTPEQSIIRKIKEVILAFWAEKVYSKDQILTLYFNQIPYGGTAWGIEAAAQTYFNKPARDLDLAECAFLAGIPQAPTLYSPYGSSPLLWKKRQKEVLTQMVRLGFITTKEKEAAQEKELHFSPPHMPIHAPHFVMYIKDLLIKKYGLAMVEKGGLEVTTTLDLSLQDMAQELVTKYVNDNAFLHLTNGASLITDPSTGDILAMIGSKDYNDPSIGAVNLTTSLRQPGSAIKLITYTAALSLGFTPATILDDSPIVYTYPNSPSYAPVNYDGKFHGKLPLRIAFANSFNIPAVKTLQKIGIPTFLDTAKAMGIESFTTPTRYGLSLTLGGAEATMIDMATAYGTVANEGKRIYLNPILKLRNSQGDLIEQKTTPEETQVISPGVAFLVSDILADNNARSMEFGPNSALVVANHRVSVKTGTTDQKRDNWTIGYTPTRLVATWVGNNDNTPMNPALASGITGAAPMWQAIMQQLVAHMPNPSLVIPESIVQKPCGKRLEYFLKTTDTSAECGSTLSSISQ